MLRLPQLDEPVRGAVHDQKRRVVLADIGDRRSLPGEVLFFLQGAAEQLVDRGSRLIHTGRVDVEQEQIAWPAKIDDASDPAAGASDTQISFELGDVAGCAEQTDEVAARRDAPHADLV